MFRTPPRAGAEPEKRIARIKNPMARRKDISKRSMSMVSSFTSVGLSKRSSHSWAASMLPLNSTICVLGFVAVKFPFVFILKVGVVSGGVEHTGVDLNFIHGADGVCHLSGIVSGGWVVAARRKKRERQNQNKFFHIKNAGDYPPRRGLCFLSSKTSDFISAVSREIVIAHI